MKTLVKNLILGFLFLGLTNCASSYFTLSPDEESNLEMGREIVEKEDDLAYSTISFEDQSDGNFMFHVFAYNKAQDNFIFDPSDIYVKIYDEDKNLLHGNNLFAIDPELQIERINEAIDDREDEHDAATGLNIVFSLVNTIVDLTDDDDNDAEEVLENVVIFTGNQINEEVSFENDIDYLKANKSYWKNEVLRRTEISKDEGIDGIVYIPIVPEAKYLKIIVPIGKTIHKFKFLQHSN